MATENNGASAPLFLMVAALCLFFYAAAEGGYGAPIYLPVAGMALVAIADADAASPFHLAGRAGDGAVAGRIDCGGRSAPRVESPQ